MSSLVKACDVLSVDVISSLSVEALRVFELLWRRMQELQSDSIALSNSALVVSAGVRLVTLPLLFAELANVGLLDIELDTRPDFAFIAQRTVFRLAK